MRFTEKKIRTLWLIELLQKAEILIYGDILYVYNFALMNEGIHVENNQS